RNGRGPEWRPLPVSYTDYALWAHRVAEETGERQLEYWREALRGLPARIPLPYDRPPSPGHRGVGEHLEFRIDAGLHRAIDALAARTGTSMFMVLQAALATLLTRNGAGAEIPIAARVAGRADDRLADLVGCFSGHELLGQWGETETPGVRAACGAVPSGRLSAVLTVVFDGPSGWGPVECVLGHDAWMCDRATGGRRAGELRDILRTLRTNA